MSKKILFKIDASGMGDTLTATPTLRKLYNAYSSKISVKSRYPQLFKKNPYVLENFHYNENLDESVYEVFKCFDFTKDSSTKYHACLTQRASAYDLGFDLLNEELHMDFFADDYCIYDFNTFGSYICFHTTSNWPNRTWTPEKWQALADMLRDSGLNIVTIGKDYSERVFDNSLIEKKCFVPRGDNVIDLTNDKSSISDLWHVINNAKAIVTLDSGPLHLAGTTDTWIFQIGSARHPQFNMPFRKATQEYKQEFIGGECSIFCASNVKYSVKEWGTIYSTHFLPKCQEGYSEMKCHPNAEQVYTRIKNKINL
jgi:ADP-heptose:LPS heptosyltransferase